MGLDMYLYRKEVDQIAYWRKANAIHGWFINHAGVEDNCKPIPLNRPDLIKLRDTCLEVLNARTTEIAEELLPPTPGFFFGSNTIDEWYWENVKETADKLTVIIDETSEDQEFEYYASW